MIEPNIEKFSIRHGMFLQDYRLIFLKAVEAGNNKKVEELLEKMPELVQAKTTTAGSSPLHIAAERGHEKICQSLLEKNHETNPVNKNGKTPYQATKSESIKKLLAERHNKFLGEKYYIAHSFNQLTASKDPLKNIVVSDTTVISSKEFNTTFSLIGAPRGIYREDSPFGISYISLLNKSTAIHLQSFFKEDILMMPYIGDFVMIKENALIFHFMKMMKQPEFKKEEYWKFIISNQSLCLNLIPELEDKAFVSSCSKALEIYPFLKNAPQQNDTPDIVETKKMFAKSIKHRDVNDINKDETIDPPQKNDTKHHI